MSFNNLFVVLAAYCLQEKRKSLIEPLLRRVGKSNKLIKEV